MDKLMTSQEVAEILGINDGTLAQWRSAGRGPLYVKVGRMVRYREDAIEDYILANIHTGEE